MTKDEETETNTVIGTVDGKLRGRKQAERKMTMEEAMPVGLIKLMTD